jgi:opacity protein-like surface antigen
MKKILLILLTTAATLTFAADEDLVEPVYINLNTGIASGYSFTNNTGNNSSQPSGSSSNNYSLGANIGYNFNQYFATEVGYNQLWLAGTPSNSGGQVGVEDIAAKGTLPLGDIFSLYARVGVGGYQNVDANSGGSFANNIGLLYGAGAQWALNKNWALRAEDWTVTGLGENVIQFGAQFAF